MKYNSVFDIIGPVMIGPSSSHTAGAVRIGLIARKIFDEIPDKIQITFYSSFKETYKGHATDVALIGGILDFSPDDVNISRSLDIANDKNIQLIFDKNDEITDHPNTVKINLYKADKSLELVGISIGGGAINIIKLDGFSVNFSGERPTLFIFHNDIYGAVATIATTLAHHKINISQMTSSRLKKGDKALMVIETDQIVDDDIIKEINKKDNIIKSVFINNV